MNTVPKPVDQVRSLEQAIDCWIENPWRVCLTLADDQPPMLAPWRPRMKLDGAVLYVHPANERAALAQLNAGR